MGPKPDDHYKAFVQLITSNCAPSFALILKNNSRDLWNNRIKRPKNKKIKHHIRIKEIPGSNKTKKDQKDTLKINKHKKARGSQTQAQNPIQMVPTPNENEREKNNSLKFSFIISFKFSLLFTDLGIKIGPTRTNPDGPYYKLIYESTTKKHTKICTSFFDLNKSLVPLCIYSWIVISIVVGESFFSCGLIDKLLVWYYYLINKLQLQFIHIKIAALLEHWFLFMKS